MQLGHLLFERRYINGEPKIIIAAKWPTYTLIGAGLLRIPEPGLVCVKRGGVEFNVSNGSARYTLAEEQLDATHLAFTLVEYSYSEASQMPSEFSNPLQKPF